MDSDKRMYWFFDITKQLGRLLELNVRACFLFSLSSHVVKAERELESPNRCAISESKWRTSSCPGTPQSIGAEDNLEAQSVFRRSDSKLEMANAKVVRVFKIGKIVIAAAEPHST